MSAVGRTKDTGWQIGVSRTFGVDVEVAWSVLTEGPGLAVWLGGGSDLPTKPGDPYTTAEGTTGELRSRRPLDRVRLTWQPRGRSTPTTLQVAVSPAASGTTVRFHQERLADAEERERQRDHWRSVLDRLAPLLSRRDA